VKLNLHGINVEVYHHPDGFWGDDRVILSKDTDKKTLKEIIQYLYIEGFIQDRRTPCQLLLT